MKNRFFRSQRGFTLIELLIVIAIILILIAIALPNFLEAQVRAKVAKSKAELRTMITAMEMYFQDFKVYPPETEDDCMYRPRSESGQFWLTTPIKYMKGIPEDAFPRREGKTLGFHCYESGGIERGAAYMKCLKCTDTWVIYSRGPSMEEPILRSANPHFELYGPTLITFNPTNGTYSSGTINYWGGDPWWIGVPVTTALPQFRQKPVMMSQFGPGLPVDYVAYPHRLPPNLK